MGRCLLNHESWGKPIIDMLLWMFQGEINVLSVDYSRKSKTSRDVHLPCVAHMYWEINTGCSLGSDNSSIMLPCRQKDWKAGSCSHSGLLPLSEFSDWIHPMLDDYFINVGQLQVMRLWLQQGLGWNKYNHKETHMIVPGADPRERHFTKCAPQTIRSARC